MAALYDALLAAAVLFAAAAVVVVPMGGPPTTTLSLMAFRLYLTTVVFLFFGWFWTHGGQTLGMRAWHIGVVRRETRAALRWADAALRFAAAIPSWLPLGAGMLWILIDRDGLAWHDRLSHTVVIDLRRR